MKTINFSFENGNLVINFEKSEMVYSKFLKVEDIKNSANYYLCSLESGLFDIYLINTETEGEKIEERCLKISDKAGYTRLFVKDTDSQKFFIIRTGYDFSYFSNAMLLNLEETKEVNLIIFNQDMILVEESGKMRGHNQSGIIIDDRRWVPYKNCPTELDPRERPLVQEKPAKKSFFDYLRERFFVAFL